MVNRALQVYALLVGAVHVGERIWLGRRRWQSKEVDIEWFPKP
jgi:hypothetical protein